MIQDIAPHRLNNHYESKTSSAISRLMIFAEGKLLCRYDETDRKIEFPYCNETADYQHSFYLFSIDDDDYFLYLGQQFPDGYSLYHLRELNRGQVKDNVSMLAAYTAYHLWKWYQDNRFCGHCGTGTVHKEDERALVCPQCGNVIYPRINPAVIIGVVNGDKLLITRYAGGFRYNALVAGFTEIGETLEETVRREVMEETGLKVKNIRYYKSQPWGIAQDLLAGFFCEVDGDDTIRMDTTELKYAQWVAAGDIELQPAEFSLTNEMMKLFKESH